MSLAGKGAQCWQVHFPHVFMLLDIRSTLHCWSYCWIQCLCCSGCFFFPYRYFFLLNLFCYQGESRSNTLEWYFMYELCFKKWTPFFHDEHILSLYCQIALLKNGVTSAESYQTRWGLGKGISRLPYTVTLAYFCKEVVVFSFVPFSIMISTGIWYPVSSLLSILAHTLPYKL